MISPWVPDPVQTRPSAPQNRRRPGDNGAMAHPSQPAQESTAALLAGYLHAAGVRHVFGYPGESYRG
jgi:hypothetical protein